jgi:hypothetical protein
MLNFESLDAKNIEVGEACDWHQHSVAFGNEFNMSLPLWGWWVMV